MNSIINILGKKTIFTNKIAFVRSIFAFSAILIILFNQSPLLLKNSSSEQNAFVSYSIFSLMSFEYASILSIIILIFVLTGYLPQISCFLQAWVHFSICASFVIVEGGDQLAANLSILLIPICIFDKRLNQWKISKNNINFSYQNLYFNIYYFLIDLQVAIVYLHAAVGKLNRPDWRDGTCLYYWFTDNTIGAPIVIQNIILTPFLLSKYLPLLTWLIIIIELSLFACILCTNSKLMRIFLYIGIIMHIGFALIHGLITFSLIAIGALILYLDKNNFVFVSIFNFFQKCILKLFTPSK